MCIYFLIHFNSSIKRGLEAKGAALFDDVTDDVSDCVSYCVIYCSIVLYCSWGMSGMYCARSRDRGHAHCVMLRSLGGASSQKFEKFQSAPIELKFGTGMFSTPPDTMVTLVLRENDVIT